MLRFQELQRLLSRTISSRRRCRSTRLFAQTTSLALRMAAGTHWPTARVAPHRPSHSEARRVLGHGAYGHSRHVAINQLHDRLRRGSRLVVVVKPRPPPGLPQHGISVPSLRSSASTSPVTARIFYAGRLDHAPSGLWLLSDRPPN